MNLWQKPIPELGLHLYSSAVDDIADQTTSCKIEKTSLLLLMAAAIRSGKLRCRSPWTAAPITVDTKGDELFPYVTIDDVNSWLEMEGFPYRWQRLTNQGLPETAHQQVQIQDQEQQILQNADDSYDLAPANVYSDEGGCDVLQDTLPPLPNSAILKKDWPGKVNLGRLLSDVPIWLRPARTMRGKRGRNGSALWNPVQIAVCLWEAKGVPKVALTQHLKTHFPEYLPAWEQLIEDDLV